jgi:hypothetical protein
MPYTYEELHHKTLAELRDIAKDITHDAVQGYTQMNKEHLVPALCQALGIDMHAHHHAASGFDKSNTKARMRTLRAQRAKAIEQGDAEALHDVRRQLHALNHRIRANTV